MSSVSVNKFVNSIMNDYDQNRNGSIELKEGSFFAGDESTYQEDRITHEGNQTVRTITEFSYDQLFIKADKNNDGKVTRDELNDVVKSYDKNNDGKLSARSFWDVISGKPAGELDVFNKEIPERSRVIYRQVISTDPIVPPIPNPPMPPHNFLTSRNK